MGILSLFVFCKAVDVDVLECGCQECIFGHLAALDVLVQVLD
jgi:hypothetical protein